MLLVVAPAAVQFDSSGFESCLVVPGKSLVVQCCLIETETCSLFPRFPLLGLKGELGSQADNVVLSAISVSKQVDTMSGNRC
jgi:hypothetical protein